MRTLLTPKVAAALGDWPVRQAPNALTAVLTGLEGFDFFLDRLAGHCGLVVTFLAQVQLGWDASTVRCAPYT
jgi:hypothetical protein